MLVLLVIIKFILQRIQKYVQLHPIELWCKDDFVNSITLGAMITEETEQMVRDLENFYELDIAPLKVNILYLFWSYFIFWNILTGPAFRTIQGGIHYSSHSCFFTHFPFIIYLLALYNTYYIIIYFSRARFIKNDKLLTNNVEHSFVRRIKLCVWWSIGCWMGSCLWRKM